MNIDLKVISIFCRNVKYEWSYGAMNASREGDDEEIEIEDTYVDTKDSITVLSKFYQFAKTFKASGGERSVLLITNKGTVIEDKGLNRDNHGIWINRRDQCLGEDENSWAAALGKIKTTSDFLAKLAVFANKHAK